MDKALKDKVLKEKLEAEKKEKAEQQILIDKALLEAKNESVTK
jgi:hypothetical protein